MVLLARHPVVELGPRGQVLGQVDLRDDAEDRRRDRLLGQPDDRRGVALVADVLERDVPQPPRRLGRHVLQPLPPLGRVDVRLAVRQRGAAEQGVVDAAQVLAGEVEPVELVAEPPAGLVEGRRVDPVGIVLRSSARSDH